MNERTKLGLDVLKAALLLGLLGDVLLRATPWGLNIFLWMGAFVVGAHALMRQKGARSASAEGRWLWAVALVFAAFFVWRDSTTLRLLDLLAILAALSLAAFDTGGGRVRAAGVFDYVLAALVACGRAAFGVFPLVLSDVKWKEIPRTGWSKHAMAVARGLLIAVPLLLVFGALFVAADAIYEGFIRDTLSFDGEIVFTHVLLFAFFTWVTGGYLRGLLLTKTPIVETVRHAARTTLNPLSGEKTESHDGGAAAETKDASAQGETGAGVTSEDSASHGGAATGGGYKFSSGEDERPSSPEAFRREAAEREARDASKSETERAQKSASTFGAKVSLGIVEIGVVIGLLDLLFLSFVVVQLRYFFGDAQHVITSAGLTFSDYARRGFFELVWVALLALPLLLAAHWLLRKENAAHVRLFRALAGVMVALLFVIMASALWRMRLYQQAYGLTELRFYTTAFMGWLGLVFVWFALTVLREQRERFVLGAFVAWLVILAALHGVNPNDLIVRTNLAQARAEGRPERFDASYAASLGADAAPALLEALDEMNTTQRLQVAATFNYWFEHERQTDWRSWNISRSRARRLMAQHESLLREGSSSDLRFTIYD